MSGYRLQPAGDTALIVEFGDRIDRDINDAVLALARELEAAQLDGVIEIAPTFRSLAIYYEPLHLRYSDLSQAIERIMARPGKSAAAGRRWRLPVCYDTSLAPDLESVAAATGLSPRQVVELHSAETYHVYMLGFLPGQAYLGDLPRKLALPRHPTPRPKIAAGSLAIAMTMTCIFPLETPCGWHLIGASPIPLWRIGRDPQPLLQPGDKVRFDPVSLGEYEHWKNVARQPDFELHPIDQGWEAAA
ncbi:MAG: 5-oxoprolinase subunit PxpB [Pseudorhodoplanes sp.]